MSETSPRRGVVVLAGGRSRRMGRDKAWLRLRGEHLLHRVVRLALDAADRVVVVASAEQMLPSFPRTEDRVIRIDDPPQRAGTGPLAGTLTGLEVLASEDVALAYVGCVDAARLTTEHIAFMLDRLAADPKCAAVVPESVSPNADRPIVHGSSGAVRVPTALIIVRDLLRKNVRSMHALYAAANAQRIDLGDLPDPEAVRSCNTPEEWREILHRSAATRG